MKENTASVVVFLFNTSHTSHLTLKSDWQTQASATGGQRSEHCAFLTVVFHTPHRAFVMHMAWMCRCCENRREVSAHQRSVHGSVWMPTERIGGDAHTHTHTHSERHVKISCFMNCLRIQTWELNHTLHKTFTSQKEAHAPQKTKLQLLCPAPGQCFLQN